MASLDQLKTWLSEAEAARHALAMGEGVVEVWRDGRRISYTSRNLKDLQSYIDWLGTEIAKAEAVAAGRPRRSAIGIRWGGRG